jgi:hypothetical protein
VNLSIEISKSEENTKTIVTFLAVENVVLLALEELEFFFALVTRACH